MIMEIMKWIFAGFSVMAAIEGSKRNGACNILRMNILYFCGNIFSVVYFITTNDWAYIFLNTAFTIISIIGISKNIKNEEEKKWKITTK